MDIIQLIQEHTAIFWLILGIVLIILEISGLSGIGFLFGGLGAITLGGLYAFSALSPSSDALLQMALFLLLTSVWAAMLWIPIKKYKNRLNIPGYNDMIGSTAEIYQASIKKGKAGHVKWSGTIMKAKLSSDCAENEVNEGTEVIIKSKEGSILIVTTK